MGLLILTFGVFFSTPGSILRRSINFFNICATCIGRSCPIFSTARCKQEIEQLQEASNVVHQTVDKYVIIFNNCD